MPQVLALPARLWRGEIPLGRAFWEFAVLDGTLANLFTTIASLSLLAADAPAAIAVVVHFLPLPYNLLMVVAVWRSAARYGGPRLWADLARLAVLLWALAATAL
jgi:hypothetical protein